MAASYALLPRFEVHDSGDIARWHRAVDELHTLEIERQSFSRTPMSNHSRPPISNRRTRTK